MTTTRQCSVEGCTRPHYGRGWCEMHYRRWYVHGDVTVNKRDERPPAPLRPGQALCSVAGCPSPAAAHGLCHKHRTRLRRHGDPTTRLTRGPSR